MFANRGSLRFRGSAIAVIASLSLGGCATSGIAGRSSGAPLTPAQQHLITANARFDQTVGEGAVIGALLGGGLGLAFGGGDRATAAAIGALAGGLLGATSGYVVARKNYEQAQTEENLQKAIGEAHADADAYARSADASIEIAADARTRMASLDAEYRSRAITASQYRSKMASFNDSAKIMHKQMATMQTEAAALRADSARSQGPQQEEMIANAGRIEIAQQTMELNVRNLEAALAEEPAG